MEDLGSGHESLGAASLVARLKALGGSVMAEKKARVRDNWAMRHDCLCFQVLTACAHMPCLPSASRCSPRRARQIREAVYDRVSPRHGHIRHGPVCAIQPRVEALDVHLQTPTGQRAVIARHVVQTTSVGFQQLYKPSLAGEHDYKGGGIHSPEYGGGGGELGQDGAGFEVVMTARSPRYMETLQNVTHPTTLGLYDIGVKEANGLAGLAAAGFPVVDGAPVASVATVAFA
ncbi:hypothetical protein MAPG_11851 [Magnaporthiopsis poae ATCC 64411]|uniref:Uncharacterized protein n=1 Tax=Magnaporthiopsis poae (strain ATCC 64411 / 73-15) TaxID=644358 RepID=A0A0C4EGC0_MAGP6|nr:hypothetical protein MAPG_11851 [Magnaporthiopsis poae ATCC 64411]